jgi:alcohol dehydrogenase
VCDAFRHIAPHLPPLLESEPDAEVLILGATDPKTLFTASLPLYTCLIARAHGARNITFADARSHIRAHAAGLGFNTLHPRRLRRHSPAPLVVDTNSNEGLALANTAPDGVCTSSGGLHRSGSIPVLRMYVRNATLHVGRTHARALIPDVLDMMADGRLHPEAIPMNVAPLDDAIGVLREHFLDGESVKTVLRA